MATEPLTPEELAELRRLQRTKNTGDIVNRLLATLDARPSGDALRDAEPCQPSKEWTYDSLCMTHRRPLRECAALVSTAPAEPAGIDVERLTTVLYDWMPEGADVSVGFDGEAIHLTGSDLARYLFDRAREYEAAKSEGTR